MRVRKAVLASLFVALVAAVEARSQIITSVGGNSSWGRILQVAVDAAGNVYTADFDRYVVHKIDRLGVSTVAAGSGGRGVTGDGGPATAATFSGPTGVAVAPDGTVYIADWSGDKIRKVAPNGIITTFAGTGAGGFAGDGGPATAARINAPLSLFLDSRGNVFFTDSGNSRIRRVAPDGIITTVAGSGQPRYAGDGSLATATAMSPGWLTVAPDGTIYFTDDSSRTNVNARVRRITPNGIVSTIAGTGTRGFSGDGGPAASAQVANTAGVALDAGGNLYISDYDNSRIRKIAPNGIITTYAGSGRAGSGGDGGPAVEGQLTRPAGLAVDGEGNLYVAEEDKRIRKISPPPVPTIRTTMPVLTSFQGSAGFSSNTYLEIYGTNFSTASRLWAGSDFNGSNAPTSLDGVSVTVNNRPAFVYYVSPTQININTPEDTATGPVAIQVKTPLGTSNSVMANRARISPTLQTIPQFNIGGKQYVVALTPDFQSYIGRPNMLAGVSFVAAKPGDTISIYALGAGPTSPPTQAGVIAPQASALALPFEVRIGGSPAAVTFAGMAAGAIGLYQLNVAIPGVAAGDQSIELIVDGVSNGQNLSIVVGQ